jgi:hypothetical protein
VKFNWPKDMHLELTNPQGTSFDTGGHRGFYTPLAAKTMKYKENPLMMPMESMLLTSLKQ